MIHNFFITIIFLGVNYTFNYIYFVFFPLIINCTILTH